MKFSLTILVAIVLPSALFAAPAPEPFLGPIGNLAGNIVNTGLNVVKGAADTAANLVGTAGNAAANVIHGLTGHHTVEHVVHVVPPVQTVTIPAQVPNWNIQVDPSQVQQSWNVQVGQPQWQVVH